MKKMSALDWAAMILLIIGGLNWGLVGAFNLNIVNTVLGSIPILETIVYILVGISAIYILFSVGKMNKQPGE